MATLVRSRGRFVGAMILLASTLRPAGAGSLVKVWELDLSKWNNSAGANPNKFPVQSLMFSPDGKQIALGGSKYVQTDGHSIGRLLIARIGSPAQDVQSFEATQGSDFVEWSPSGDAVVVNGLIVGLDDHTTCRAADSSRFISEDQLIAIKPVGPSYSSYRLTIYDKRCRQLEAWDTPERWVIADVSIQRHLLLMSKYTEENLLVDPDDGRVVRKWSMGTWPLWDGPGGQFADNGKALCGELSLDDAPKGKTMRCWNTDTGELIGNAPADYATSPFVTSRSSTRVVFSEVGYVRGLISDWDTHPYKGAVVWDYATGERLAAWRPRTQTWTEQGLRPPRKMAEPSQVAISADGQFVAEGGNGRLTVYKIER